MEWVGLAFMLLYMFFCLWLRKDSEEPIFMPRTRRIIKQNKES